MLQLRAYLEQEKIRFSDEKLKKKLSADIFLFAMVNGSHTKSPCKLWRELLKYTACDDWRILSILKANKTNKTIFSICISNLCSFVAQWNEFVTHSLLYVHLAGRTFWSKVNLSRHFSFFSTHKLDSVRRKAMKRARKEPWRSQIRFQESQLSIATSNLRRGGGYVYRQTFYTETFSTNSLALASNEFRYLAYHGI